MKPDEVAALQRYYKENYAICNYLPSPTQKEMHQSCKHTRLVTGGMRCLAGSQTIYDPVLGTHRRIDSIQGDFHVLAWDGNGPVTALALEPTIIGQMPLYRIHLSDGSHLDCTLTHRVMCADGEYREVCELLEGYAASHHLTISGISRRALLADVRRCLRTREDSRGDYHPSPRLCGQQLHLVKADAQVFVPSLAYAQEPRSVSLGSRQDGCSLHALLNDALASRAGHTRGGLAAAYRLSRRGALRQKRGYARESQQDSSAELPSQRQIGGNRNVRLSPDLSSYVQEAGEVRPQNGSLVDSCVMPPVLEVTGVTSLGKGNVWDTTVPQYHNYLAGSVWNHNSGKSLSCLVEVIWLALGIHPDKQNYHGPLNILIICLTRQQASQVAQRKLMECSELPGKFHDVPLIPPNEIAEDSPASVKVGFPVYYQIRLKNGTVIDFAWSDDPKSWKKAQGQQRDLIYLDEAECSKRFLRQIRARLRDSRSAAIRGEKPEWAGSLLWGATGTGTDEAFEEVREYCLDGKHDDHALFVLKPGETGAIDKRILELERATMSEDEAAVFIDGTATAAGMSLVYGKQWNDARHMLPQDYIVKPEDNLWLGFDPGIEHAAALLITCLTPSQPYQKKVVKCWQEKNSNLQALIELLDHWLCGRRLAGVVYDTQAKNRQLHANSLIEEFMKHMAARGMQPHAGYYRAHKNHWQGILRVRTMLDPDYYNKNVEPNIVVNPSQESGGPQLRFQMKSYRGKEETKFTGPGGLIRKNDDLCDCLRYTCLEQCAAGYNPIWACGKGTKQSITHSGPPVPLADLAPKVKTWEEILLERSQMAQRMKGKRIQEKKALIRW